MFYVNLAYNKALAEVYTKFMTQIFGHNRKMKISVLPLRFERFDFHVNEGRGFI